MIPGAGGRRSGEPFGGHSGRLVGSGPHYTALCVWLSVLCCDLEIVRRVDYVLSSVGGGVPQFKEKKKEKNFIVPLSTVHSIIYPTPSKISDVRHHQPHFRDEK